MKSTIIPVIIAFLTLSLKVEAQLPVVNQSSIYSNNNVTAYIKVISEEIDDQDGQFSLDLKLYATDTTYIDV